MVNYNREMLFGRWYRSDETPQGGSISEYSEMTIDGCYEFTFIEYDAEGKQLGQTIELGDWGLVGDIHFTLAKSEFIDNEHYAVDFSNENNYHAYKILQLTSQIFEYQHLISNEVFIMRRVIDKIGHC